MTAIEDKFKMKFFNTHDLRVSEVIHIAHGFSTEMSLQAIMETIKQLPDVSCDDNADADIKLIVFMSRILHEHYKHEPEKFYYILNEMIKGAHICLEDPDGSIFKMFHDLHSMRRKRFSSHAAIGDQYALSGDVIPEFLFAQCRKKDPVTGEEKLHMWFQLEAHSANHGNIFSAKSFINLILHLIDWIKYKITGKNVGPFGLSSHHDANPIILAPKI